jgi:hypothetical protein
VRSSRATARAARGARSPPLCCCPCCNAAAVCPHSGAVPAVRLLMLMWLPLRCTDPAERSHCCRRGEMIEGRGEGRVEMRDGVG